MDYTIVAVKVESRENIDDLVSALGGIDGVTAKKVEV